MISSIWITFLYQPLLNALVWIYSNLAGESLGWAVVCLTIILRILILPLTIKSSKDDKITDQVEKESIEKSKAYKGDIIAQKEAIRESMRRNKVSPWAKFVSLAIQLLVLVLLYQVFVGGIEGRKIVIYLYSFIDYPGLLNTNFYGFNIGLKHDFFWSGLVAVYLIVSILWANRNSKWDGQKASFLILFPLASFLVLWFLPMVKSLFVLTSMVFSDIVELVIKLFTPKKEDEE